MHHTAGGERLERIVNLLKPPLTAIDSEKQHRCLFERVAAPVALLFKMVSEGAKNMVNRCDFSD